jgi:hypothetical protein
MSSVKPATGADYSSYSVGDIGAITLKTDWKAAAPLQPEKLNSTPVQRTALSALVGNTNYATTTPPRFGSYTAGSGVAMSNPSSGASYLNGVTNSPARQLFKPTPLVQALQTSLGPAAGSSSAPRVVGQRHGKRHRVGEDERADGTDQRSDSLSSVSSAGAVRPSVRCACRADCRVREPDRCRRDRRGPARAARVRARCARLRGR